MFKHSKVPCRDMDTREIYIIVCNGLNMNCNWTVCVGNINQHYCETNLWHVR